jgi:hypothetical protein
MGDIYLQRTAEAGMRDSLGRLTDPVAFLMNRVGKAKRYGGLAVGLAERNGASGIARNVRRISGIAED